MGENSLITSPVEISNKKYLGTKILSDTGKNDKITCNDLKFKSDPNFRERTEIFAKFLCSFFKKHKGRVPLIFLDQQGEKIRLDKGCLGFLYNCPSKTDHSKSYINFAYDKDGYIQTVTPNQKLLDKVSALETNNSSNFDPTDDTDGREKILTRINGRQGQEEFRNSLLKAYNYKCAITGCDVVEALEAAHISSYKGVHTNAVVNGLLLRADIHTLFDLRLIKINPDTMKVFISKKLQDSQYKNLDGIKIHLPKSKDDQPNKEALKKHSEEEGLLHQ